MFHPFTAPRRMPSTKYRWPNMKWCSPHPPAHPLSPPRSKGTRPLRHVVPPVAVVDPRRPAELGGQDHQRLVLQPVAFEAGKLNDHRLVRDGCLTSPPLEVLAVYVQPVWACPRAYARAGFVSWRRTGIMRLADRRRSAASRHPGRRLVGGIPIGSALASERPAR